MRFLCFVQPVGDAEFSSIFLCFFISGETSLEQSTQLETNGASSIFAPLCARAEIKYAKKSSGHDIFEDTRFAPFLCGASFAARTYICTCAQQLHAVFFARTTNGPFFSPLRISA